MKTEKEEIKLLARLMMCAGIKIEDWEPDIFKEIDEIKRLLKYCCTDYWGRDVVILEFDMHTRELCLLDSKFKVCDEKDIVFKQIPMQIDGRNRNVFAVEVMGITKAVTTPTIKFVAKNIEYERTLWKTFDLVEFKNFLYYVWPDIKTYHDFCVERVELGKERAKKFIEEMSIVKLQTVADVEQEYKLGTITGGTYIELLCKIDQYGSNSITIGGIDKGKSEKARGIVNKWLDKGILNFYVGLEPDEFLKLVQNWLVQECTDNQEIKMRYQVFEKLNKIIDL